MIQSGEDSGADIYRIPAPSFGGLITGGLNAVWECQARVVGNQMRSVKVLGCPGNFVLSCLPL